MSQYHLFSLPRDLLDTLIPRNVLSQPQEPTAPSLQESPPPQSQPASGSRACNICLGSVFVDVEDQRAHFRSDWHRYNVKARLGGGEPVSESDFAQLVDGMLYTLSVSRNIIQTTPQVSKTLYPVPLHPNQSLTSPMPSLPLCRRHANLLGPPHQNLMDLKFPKHPCSGSILLQLRRLACTGQFSQPPPLLPTISKNSRRCRLEANAARRGLCS